MIHIWKFGLDRMFEENKIYQEADTPARRANILMLREVENEDTVNRLICDIKILENKHSWLMIGPERKCGGEHLYKDNFGIQ